MPGNGDDDKEKKRKKQIKRMSKILGKLWDLDADFQDANDNSSKSAVHCLTDVGQRMDQGHYKVGRHGWEDFSRDLGGVYQQHIQRYETICSIPMSVCDSKRELLRSRCGLLHLTRPVTPKMEQAQTIGLFAPPFLTCHLLPSVSDIGTVRVQKSNLRQQKQTRNSRKEALESGARAVGCRP
jgi:hypothetical protein